MTPIQVHVLNVHELLYWEFLQLFLFPYSLSNALRKEVHLE